MAPYRAEYSRQGARASASTRARFARTVHRPAMCGKMCGWHCGACCRDRKSRPRTRDAQLARFLFAQSAPSDERAYAFAREDLEEQRVLDAPSMIGRC